jgi:hypothetical protein
MSTTYRGQRYDVRTAAEAQALLDAQAAEAGFRSTSALLGISVVWGAILAVLIAWWL